MKTNTIVACANAKASKKNIATPKPAHDDRAGGEQVARWPGAPARGAEEARARCPRRARSPPSSPSSAELDERAHVLVVEDHRRDRRQARGASPRAGTRSCCRARGRRSATPPDPQAGHDVREAARAGLAGAALHVADQPLLREERLVEARRARPARRSGSRPGGSGAPASSGRWRRRAGAARRRPSRRPSAPSCARPSSPPPSRRGAPRRPRAARARPSTRAGRGRPRSG